MRIEKYEDTLKSKTNYVYIDTRSPKEFEEATIPGAVNIPIFTDDERAEIGTIYKQIGPREATQRGLEFIAPKLNSIYTELMELTGKNTVLACFCARGGMRSSSVVSLYSVLGFNMVKIEGGYKGYRAYVNKELPETMKNINYITLYGKTGTGKTLLLKELEKQGYDVLDLEKCANHRGSLLGSVGLGKQSSQKTFESLVFETLRKRKTDTVFVEGESKRIGKVVMPNYMYDCLLNSRKVLIEADIKFRVNVIKDDYINEKFEKAQLYEAFEKLSRYISNEKLEYYTSLVEEEDFDELIEDLMINYYDNNYMCKDRVFETTIVNDNVENCVKEILEKML